MEIRRGVITDLEQVQYLNHQLFELEFANYDKDLKVDWSLGDSAAEYFKELIVNHIIYVAEINSEVVGYIAGRIIYEDSYIFNKFVELENMFINECYQRLGIGGKLLNCLKNDCKEKNAKSIKVVASYGNNQAINFYKKNLFENKDVVLLSNL